MNAVISDRAHIPVLLAEVIEALAPVDGGLYIDGTFGAGGYSRSILTAAKCRVIGIDRDPQAQARGHDLAAAADGRFQMVPGCFADMDQLVKDAPTGIVLDIGVSSMQLDQAERGFSFQADGPLDMRMEGLGSAGQSAADVVNSASETELADIIYYFGEERLSRRIARALVAARITAPIERTTQLAEIVARAVPRREPGRHPATKTFQALRIHVNDELGQLARGLAAAERLLPEGARLVVVTFHSLEDRVVKRFFSGDEADAAPASRHLPMQRKGPAQPAFKPFFRGHRSAGPAELAANPRARSAKLRAGIRTSAAPRKLAALDLGLPELVRIAA